MDIISIFMEVGIVIFCNSGLMGFLFSFFDWFIGCNYFCGCNVFIISIIL